MASRSKRKKKVERKTCQMCNKDLILSSFFVSPNKLHVDGKVPFCKDCIKSVIYTETGDFNVEEFKNILQQVDRPFVLEWIKSSIQSKHDTLGSYFRILNIKHNMSLTWNDSKFGDAEDADETSNLFICPDNVRKKELINRWGDGYSTEEYEAFERKFNTLKASYPLRTELHEEALLIYVRYRVKEEFAIAEDNVRDAKEWGKLAQEASKSAKINPNQLSKSDLQGGLDGFGQLAREVEQAVDIIPILPKFIEKPKDKVDFTILCYINYVRDLKGLPPAKYKEIYEFYEHRKKDMENSGGYWDEELEEQLEEIREAELNSDD